MTDLAKELEDYFNNTPQEQLDKDWGEIKPLNDVGIDALGWAEFVKKIKPLDSDISQWVDKNFNELI